jgi:hypothetical protein
LVLASTSGTTLPTGTRIRVGFFNNPSGNAAIISGNDFAAIDAIFNPLGEGDVGGGTVSTGSLAIGATAGRFSYEISGITQAYLAAGVPLYYWVLNSNQIAAGNGQWAIFSNNDSNNGGTPWVAPVDDPVLGGSIPLAVTNLRIDDADDIARGAVAGTQLRLEVPEPTSLSFLGLGLLALFRRRR